MSNQKVYAEPQRGHVSLGRPLRAVLFLVPVVIVSILLYLIVGREASAAAVAAAVIIGVVLSPTNPPNRCNNRDWPATFR